MKKILLRLIINCRKTHKSMYLEIIPKNFYNYQNLKKKLKLLFFLIILLKNKIAEKFNLRV